MALARWLLLARHRNGADELPLTHEFLAMMLAVRRPGVTVATGTFEQAGFIQNRRGIVRIIVLRRSKRFPANATGSFGSRNWLYWAEIPC